MTPATHDTRVVHGGRTTIHLAPTDEEIQQDDDLIDALLAINSVTSVVLLAALALALHHFFARRAAYARRMPSPPLAVAMPVLDAADVDVVSATRSSAAPYDEHAHACAATAPPASHSEGQPLVIAVGRRLPS